MVDLIAKKRHGQSLADSEIDFFIEGYTKDVIPDYQAAAMAMAICFAGMDARETARMTLAMARSGDTVDLSSIPGVKVDKHSTGGVGDKTTLIVAPIVAALGVAVAKMSGRGLGHTGGTIDKLESIPGYRTALARDEFLNCVRQTGISIAGQSGNLAPADKKLYALRDATATVDSIPLIASSIMSKKIAAGADAIVLDVKMGSGAFVKTLDDARALAGEMVSIGQATGRETVALITDMDTPLGYNIGNALEIIEAVAVLSGEGPGDLAALCVELSANMLYLAGEDSINVCRDRARRALKDGAAIEKLCELVEAQGGDASYIRDPSKFPTAAATGAFKAPEDGYITHMDAEGVGRASMLLGAGRADKDSAIDHSAGIVLKHKTGACVKRGDTIALLYAADAQGIEAARAVLGAAVTIGNEKPPERPLIHDRIGGNREE
jgi:pyrimidine-nucleoside phosphorylase